MNDSSPRRGAALVETLLTTGVRDVVAAPGSRSAPLLLAVADAERAGLMRLHVRVDERSAGYLALGLARVSGRPVAVITTSGTAAINLHPAVVEAAYLGVPLVAVTADRPASLRGSGANQTIEQVGLFGVDAPTVDLTGDQADEGQLLSQAVSAAVRESRPVHVNVAFSEPLVAAGEHAVRAAATSSPEDIPVRERGPLRDLCLGIDSEVDLGHGIVIVGDGATTEVRSDVRDLAEVMGWPIVSEPSGNLSATPSSLAHGVLLLTDPDVRTALEPTVVLTVGRIGLHRGELALLRGSAIHVAVDVPPFRGRVDPARTAAVMVDAVPLAIDGLRDPSWLAAWQAADRARADDIDTTMDQVAFSGPVVARSVVAAATADDLLVVGASWPVRHVSEFAGAIAAECVSNRGTSGIDGVVSTAWGAAIAHGDRSSGVTYALLGDLTALYDRNGLVVPAVERHPRLAYVVIDNNGGGIFSSLEQGAREFTQDFERVFGTPLDADLPALLQAPDVDLREVHDVAELRDSLANVTGVVVIVARCVDRSQEQDISLRLRDAR